MRTAIFMGMALIATAINPTYINEHAGGLILLFLFILGVLDGVDFFGKKFS